MAGPDTVLWSWGPGESRLALLADGEVVELVVDRPELWAGSLFLGRVVAVDRQLDAAFVDIGIGDRPGFLPGAKRLGLTEGQALPVQVRADAWGGKGPLLAVATECGAGDRKAPALLRRSHPLERLVETYPAITRIVADDVAAFAEARALFPTLAERGEVDLDDAFAAALAPVVVLPSGGRLVIEPTAALTAIDVDSGAGRAGDANREAVAAIARQLRLRRIGGQVVVDFVSGPKGTPYRLAAGLKKVVAADPVPTHVFGVTPLGMVELVRERRGPSLAEVLCRRSQGPSAETTALTALRRVLAEAVGRPGLAPVLVVAPEVAAALGRLGEAVAEAGRRLGRPLMVRAEPGRAWEDTMIEEARK